jgi:hypothetical protein
MAPDDDDFWTTYIAATPEEDNDFRSTGRHILWPIAVVLATTLIVALLW